MLVEPKIIFKRLLQARFSTWPSVCNFCTKRTMDKTKFSSTSVLLSKLRNSFFFPTVVVLRRCLPQAPTWQRGLLESGTVGSKVSADQARGGLVMVLIPQVHLLPRIL